MLNDTDLAGYYALSTVEPYIFEDPTTGEPSSGQHRSWQTFLPTTRRVDGEIRHKYRAAIWVNATVRAQQVPLDSYDMVATLLDSGLEKLLLVAAYDPQDLQDGRAEADETIDNKLRQLSHTITQCKAKHGEDLQILLTTDFNRHHPIWTGKYNNLRSHEGSLIVRFAAASDLQSILPPGVITWQHQSRAYSSTVDVIFASENLVQKLERCNLHPTDHGSDHCAIDIYTDNGLLPQQAAPTKGRLLFANANWTAISLAINRRLPPLPDETTAESLDQAVTQFCEVISQEILQAVPRAKPSPHAKRWWTGDLTILRQSMTAARNRVVALQRRGDSTTAAQQDHQVARKLYFQEMDRQKKKHWIDFLEDPDNIWKANQYTKKTNSMAQIPKLKRGSQEAETDEAKASLLMDTFFPVPPQPMPHSRNTKEWLMRQRKKTQDLPPTTTAPISLREIREAINNSSPRKAAGPDEMSFQVWQHLLEPTITWIRWLYQASLDLAYIPAQWRTAKIVAIRKPGKPDYTVPKAFRPISLLNTLSKGLEAVVAKRLSYLAERYSLLPNGHFGGRPQRSCEDAINKLVIAIHQAWRRKRVLSLITFDVQGAFNGVFPAILGERLRERGISPKLVRWIVAFCSDRSAMVQLGSFTSSVSQIRHAGIPQGSPMSPILYIFYNANLVDLDLGKKGSTIGFIDDFTAWISSDTAQEATTELQNKVIPHVEAWARESGAIFEADKTGLIHFIRPLAARNTERTAHIRFMDRTICPVDALRILGVHLDYRLRMDTHWEKTLVKASRTCHYLASVKALRPRQMRQLYQAVVTTQIDYAGSTWFATNKRGTLAGTNMLQTVDKLGACRVTSAFRTVSYTAVTDEAAITPTRERLEYKVAAAAVRVASMPTTHPLGSRWQHLASSGGHHVSPLAATLQHHKQGLLVGRKLGPTIRQPFGPRPWQELATVSCADSWQDALCKHDEIIRKIRNNLVIYTDASVRDGLAGAAAILRQNRQANSLSVIVKETIGRSSTCSVASAEAKAITLAIRSMLGSHSIPRRVWIFTDSQLVLQQLEQRRGSASTFEAIQQALFALEEGVDRGWSFDIRWIPAHKGIAGNNLADKTARLCTETTQKPSQDPEIRIRERKAVLTNINRAILAAQTKERRPKYGAWTYSLDRALPGKHTVRLYGNLTREQAAILVQARTGHTFLHSYTARIDQTASAACKCGAEREDVQHLMLTCPEWSSQRQVLRETAGDRWGDLSYLLGGWSGRRSPYSGALLDGPKEKWAANMRVVKASIEFLRQTTRMQVSSVGKDIGGHRPGPSQTNTIDNYFVQSGGRAVSDEL